MASKLVIDLEEFTDIDFRVGEQVMLNVRGVVVRHETPVVDASGFEKRAFLPTGAELEILIEEIS